MAEWACEHTVFTRASRQEAWSYWTDLRNHARLEPGVERIELDGPFATGTTGRTIGTGFSQEWTLEDVVEGRRFVITGLTPGKDGALSFAWEFEEEGTGTRLTQRIRAWGPQVEDHLEEFRQMQVNAPHEQARLAAELDRRADADDRRGAR